MLVDGALARVHLDLQAEVLSWTLELGGPLCCAPGQRSTSLPVTEILAVEMQAARMRRVWRSWPEKARGRGGSPGGAATVFGDWKPCPRRCADAHPPQSNTSLCPHPFLAGQAHALVIYTFQRSPSNPSCWHPRQVTFTSPNEVRVVLVPGAWGLLGPWTGRSHAVLCRLRCGAHRCGSEALGGCTAPHPATATHISLCRESPPTPKNTYTCTHFSANPMQAVLRAWEAAVRSLLQRQAHRPRHLLVIVNPYCGSRLARATWATTVRPVLAKAGVRCTTLESAARGHAADLVRRHLEALEAGPHDPGPPVDGLLAVGGDGLFHEMVNALLAARLAAGGRSRRLAALRLGHVPAGSTDAGRLSFAFFLDCALADLLLLCPGKPGRSAWQAASHRRA